MKHLLPNLIPMLKWSSPNLAYHENNTWKVQELVKLSHLCNCLVCHAPSLSDKDLVRGLVPKPGEDPPPLYYKANSGLFVQANVTFLRQDFSVIQPVLQSGKWPNYQRFDYLVRTRTATENEIAFFKKAQSENFEQRESLLFTLLKLTSVNLGDNFDAWQPFLKEIRKEESPQKQ